MKKLNELTTLCGVEACAIVYQPSHDRVSDHDHEPEVWPSSPETVQKVLTRFIEMPEFERYRKMVNHEDFMRQRVMKATEKLKKKVNENMKMESTLHLYKYLETGMVPENLSLPSQNGLACLIDEKLKEIEKKMEELMKEDQNQEAQISHQDMVDGGGVAENNNEGNGLENILDLF